MTALTATPEFCYYIGNSMRRVFQAGDRLYLEFRPLSEIRVGDIVCFVNPDSKVNVVHRVIKVLPDGLVTCGDNNAKPDPQIVDATNYLGLVVRCLRQNRQIPVRNCLSGRVQFWLNRCRRNFRRAAGWGLRWLSAGGAPLWFLRGCFGTLILRKFAQEQMCFSSRGRLLAVKKNDWQKWKISGIYKLIFSSKWLEDKFHE